MTILKQFPSKNVRSKGFKVKHFLQICLLLGICFWLLHQVKNSYYDGKKAYAEGGITTPSEVRSEHENIKLGRKDIHFPIQQTTSARERQDDADHETKDDKPEETKGKSEEEESEEVEDLIDEEDREREDETPEQENEEAENQLEDESLLVN